MKGMSMFTTVVLLLSVFAGAVALGPITGVVSAAQADFIYVEAGGPYYNTQGWAGDNDTYQITAVQMQTDAGPYSGSIPEVTIYNATMVKIVDAQPMDLVDAALGLYNYSGSCDGLEPGPYHVVVSGTNSTTSAITATGLSSFTVEQLTMKIDVIEPNPVEIDVEAVCYYNFNTMVGVQLTQDGGAYVLDPADELRITIWQSGGAKDVNNDTMTVQDASAGLYRYDFNPAFPGVWLVVVNLTETASGLKSTGMDQLLIPYPPDEPIYYNLDVEAAWDSDMVVTAQLTANGNAYFVDTATEEARITVWDITDGSVLVNDEVMEYFDNTIGLFNYSKYISSSDPVYVFVTFYPWSSYTVSGTALLAAEEMIAIPVPPADKEIRVEAGYIHNPWSSGLGITATVLEEAESRPDDGSTPVQVSIYHSDPDTGVFTQVLNNQSMSVLDGPRGMYNYIWNPTTPHYGYYHIIVEVEEWSNWYVGTTSIDVAEWVETIEDIEMRVMIINMRMLDLQADFDNTWFQWQNFFNNYSADLNTTLANINGTIANISVDVDFSGMENHIVALLNNISGNISMVDQNVSSMNLQVNANAIQLANIITMLTQMDANQTVIDQVVDGVYSEFRNYRNQWNITLAQIINDLDFQNLTLLAIQSGVADFHTDQEDFWNDFNDTMASTVNDWFNYSWNQIQMFENNVTGMLNSQNMNFTLMENNIVAILNDQNFNISLIDQNITNIDNAMQQGFQNLYDNHSVMRTHISNYWSEWNTTIGNIQADIDWLNSTLVIVLEDIAEVNLQLLSFRDDFNTTWNDYHIGFAAYWQLLNLTIEGVNQTLQSDIAALSTQMTTFENNMNAMLNSISGNIAAIDQNVSDMRTAMDSHFVQLWNEHNETRDLVGFYWAEWNSTLDALIADLDYVNMTTISTNNAMTVFKANFVLFWNDYNGTEAAHSTEVETWFTTTWNRLGAFEMRNLLMLEDQNDNLTDIDNQLASGFTNLYRENAMTRSHISVYWNSWNTTRDNVQTDLDFIDGELADLGDAGEARDSKLNIHTVLLIICIISAVFMMVVFRKYIAYSFKKKK